MSTIVAIGGYVGHGGDASMKSLPIDREIVKLARKKRPRALFIPTASEDAQRYVDWFYKMYGKKLKCETDVLFLSKATLPKNKIASKIRSADIIYVGGGNTLKMMLRWKRFGVDRLLKQAYKRNIVLAGVSAGSICWFQYGVSDSRQFKNPTSKEYIRVTGLGLIDGLHCPHFKSALEDKGFRSSGLKKISRRTPGVAIAIGDGCAMEFTNGVARRVIRFGGKGKAYAIYWENGRYFERLLK